MKIRVAKYGSENYPVWAVEYVDGDIIRTFETEKQAQRYADKIVKQGNAKY